MTPLMVAAVRGGGIDTGEDEEEDSTAAVIADLVAQGAKLNATMDKTGETSLHLAARYARADAAKRLLDAGADANSQDNTGRTPLHAAVAADAMGVFQVIRIVRVLVDSEVCSPSHIAVDRRQSHRKCITNADI
jgi:Notch-like protein